MANLRKPIPLKRHSHGCAGQGSHRRPDHTQEAGRSALSAGFQDFYAGRVRLALWLLERHSRLGMQRARAALMLVLSNVLLVGLILLLALLSLITLQSTLLWVFLVCLSLTLISALFSTLFALRSVGGMHQAGGPPISADPSIFFYSGEGELTSPGCLQTEDQFRQHFLQATRQQMLDGVISEVYTHSWRRVKQERWFRRARVLFALALILFVLTVLGLFLALVW